MITAQEAYEIASRKEPTTDLEEVFAFIREAATNGNFRLNYTCRNEQGKRVALDSGDIAEIERYGFTVYYTSEEGVYEILWR